MSRSTKVLIVDDTPSSLTLLGDLLTLKGYSVLTAASGPEALKILESERPDLILMDVLMPRMNGYQVCRRIRENPAMQTLPIIMMTGLDPSEETFKGREAGATDIIVKPIHLAGLLERLQSLETNIRDTRSSSV